MADVDSARAWHSGSTVLTDIQGLASPDRAPHSLRFSPELTAIFRMQFDASFPGGKSKEQGCTIAADNNGAFSAVNLGGISRSEAQFKADLNVRQPGLYVVGAFHTHPYDAGSGNVSGVSFSGGDIVGLINNPFLLLAVVQSGPRLFAFLKTALTPKRVPPTQTELTVSLAVNRRQLSGNTFQQASRMTAQAMAVRYHLAYYQGANGVVTRV